MNKITKIFLIGFLGCSSLSAQAAWQCAVVNSINNQTWIGVGPSRPVAMENAIRFCSSHSSYIKNCNIQGCFKK